MKRFPGCHNGFSLMEILVSVMLLAGVGVMAMSSFVSSTKASKPGTAVAYNFGRGLLEQKYEYVRADQWGTASLPLSLSSPGPQGQIKSLNGTTFTANYTVTTQEDAGDADALEDFRKVTMTVSW